MVIQDREEDSCLIYGSLMQGMIRAEFDWAQLQYQKHMLAITRFSPFLGYNYDNKGLFSHQMPGAVSAIDWNYIHQH